MLSVPMSGLGPPLSTRFGALPDRNLRFRRRIDTAPLWPGPGPSYTLRREIFATTTRDGSGQRMNSVVRPFGSITFWYGVPW